MQLPRVMLYMYNTVYLLKLCDSDYPSSRRGSALNVRIVLKAGECCCLQYDQTV